MSKRDLAKLKNALLSLFLLRVKNEVADQIQYGIFI